MGRRKNNPTLFDVGYNDNAIRNAKTVHSIKGGNCQNEIDLTISDEKLPSRKKVKINKNLFIILNVRE